jgi:arsenite methyltransferase
VSERKQGRDRWARWVLKMRQDPDPDDERRAEFEQLRERVLDNGDVRPGDVFLDVGCGDGWIGFSALDRVGPNGRVMFADVSQDLIDHCRTVAAERGVLARCEFLTASADELPLADASVDVVATRSVLIYLDRAGKERALREFHRVLGPGGRLSIAEPINAFAYPEPDGWLMGYDLHEVAELVRKVRGQLSPPGESTLVDFDERDLLAWAEASGFDPLRLDYEAKLEPGSWMSGSWERVLNLAGNPLAPTLGEAIEQALTPDERGRFEARLRPLVETNAGRGRMAFALLTGVKP